VREPEHVEAEPAPSVPTSAPPTPHATGSGIGGYAAASWEALHIRNIWICVVMGIVLVAYLVITWAFMPLYLTQVRGYSASDQSWLMGTLGISATLGSFLTAGLSDVIGRRPVMIAMPFISLLLPLGAMYYTGPYIGMVAIFFVGWALNGIFPLFMATVPSESVPPAMAATVFGLCMGACEIVGGAGGPAIAGIFADQYGLQAPLWIMAGLTVVGGLFAFGLKESAPRVLARRGLRPAAA
jgi:predicted MFS family arabinose efflux permease